MTDQHVTSTADPGRISVELAARRTGMSFQRTQMLEWTAAGSGARFMGIVHHDDAEREWAYDRNSRVGRLDKALDEGMRRGWTIASMKRDWKKIFAFEP